jgi:hypothetical protein
MSTDRARELQAIKPGTAPSPLRGFEDVRGFGIFSFPFDSGHGLALRVFPQNDSAPYRTIGYRTPDGGSGGVRLDLTVTIHGVAEAVDGETSEGAGCADSGCRPSDRS